MTALENATDYLHQHIPGLSACTQCDHTYRRGSTDTCELCDGTVEPVYSGPELAHLARATYRQIDHWTRVGLLDETAGGSGTRRAFTPRELDLVRLVVELIRHGFTVRDAFRIAHQVVDHDTYTAVVADIYQLTITIRDTTDQPAEEPRQ